MPFKHSVTDSHGNVHTRTSAARSYSFAVVRRWEGYNVEIGDGIIRQVEGGASASWCSREDLARKEAAKYIGSDRFIDAEVIPCTPVATGKHAIKAA